jgi:hypothetical protein
VRIEGDLLAQQIELVVEIGDLVALADSETREILAGPQQVLAVPSEITWTVPREGRLGWALLNASADLILYIGDVHSVHRGDLYTAIIPDRQESP